jgi:hypothetical protein
MVNCIGAPEHPLVKGTTVMIELSGILERLVEGICYTCSGIGIAPVVNSRRKS